MKRIIYFVAIAVIFAFALGDVFATKPGNEFQSNRLVLDGDAAPIDEEIMDTDKERSGINSMMSDRMEACEDIKPEKTCKKWKKKGKCATEKVAKVCKKTCDLCQDDCHDTLESLHCLSKCPTPVNGSNPANYHHILGRCYYFQTTPISFTDAMDHCETIFGTPGGRLFEPRNSKVNDAVANKAFAISNNHWWIGIRAVPDRIPRHFYWLSGGPFTSLSYGNWITGEPNDDDAGEDCVELAAYTSDGRWNDVTCLSTLPRISLSICEQGHEVIW